MEQDELIDPMNAEELQALYAKTAYMLRESRKEVLISGLPDPLLERVDAL